MHFEPAVVGLATVPYLGDNEDLRPLFGDVLPPTTNMTHWFQKLAFYLAKLVRGCQFDRKPQTVQVVEWLGLRHFRKRYARVESVRL